MNRKEIEAEIEFLRKMVRDERDGHYNAAKEKILAAFDDLVDRTDARLALADALAEKISALKLTMHEIRETDIALDERLDPAWVDTVAMKRGFYRAVIDLIGAHDAYRDSGQ